MGCPGQFSGLLPRWSGLRSGENRYNRDGPSTKKLVIGGVAYGSSENAMLSNDPREIPLYSLAQAARWVGVPKSTLQKWVFGRDERQNGRIVRADRLITPADRQGALSFANLVEIHILSATRRFRIPVADIRAALDIVLSDEPTAAHPLLSGRFHRSGKRLFVESLNEKVAASKPIQGQRPLGDLLDQYLDRIVVDDALDPIQLFPMKRNDSQRVVLDFNISSGRPVVKGTGILVECLADLYKAGTSVSTLANEYRLDEQTVVSALDFLAAA